jgi:GAF domain-containing protein
VSTTELTIPERLLTIAATARTAEDIYWNSGERELLDEIAELIALVQPLTELVGQ